MSDPEIVVKSKLNLICEVYISSNATNEWMNWDEWRQMIYNEQQDSDEMIDNETAKWWKTLNKIWWIIRYNKFWRQYNMMNTIDNKIRTGAKQ